MKFNVGDRVRVIKFFSPIMKDGATGTVVRRHKFVEDAVHILVDFELVEEPIYEYYLELLHDEGHAGWKAYVAAERQVHRV